MSSYRIVENETDTAVVWIANSAEGGSEVYASIKGEENLEQSDSFIGKSRIIAFNIWMLNLMMMEHGN